MFLARVCAGCGGVGPSPCDKCIAALRRVGEMPAPEPLAALFSAFVYVGPGREMLARLKYRNQRCSVRWLAAAMAVCVEQNCFFDMVTWAPTSARRRRQRGFDQAELLARAVGGLLGLSTAALLKRIDGAGQTGLSRQERFGAIEFKVRRQPQGRILLVDDVVTTGATLQAASRALLQAGAESVEGLVAAATPLPYTHPATSRPVSSVLTKKAKYGGRVSAA
ncbi:MAG: ComF family protein [bacterium]|nr:ComF family protein [bacterium]